ncbi:MAG: peptidylprolyl isomerase [Cyanobacteria bacterium J06641_5]
MRVDVVQPIDDVVVGDNAPDSIINLFDNFDDPFTTGQVVTFQVENLDGAPNGGQIELVLFDQPGEGAPIATERFSSLVNDGSFDNLIINRGDVGFVIQAGQFTIDPETLTVGAVPTVPTIQGQPSPERSNTLGTIAFAQSNFPGTTTSNPDSATSQFFFNLSDSNSFLDEQGFTSFGAVLTVEDFAVTDAIANDPVFTPFQGNSGFIDGSVDLNEVIFFSDISIESQD